MELNELIQAVKSYTAAEEAEPVLTEAYQIAAEAHKGFRRVTGEPFLSHPLAVAGILAEWHAPVNVVAVGMLHDIHSLDYSRGYDLDHVRFKLGPDVCRLLQAMVNLNKFIKRVEGEFAKAADINNLRDHIPFVLQQERDVVVIKIADRLHNLQTVSFLSRDVQERTAQIGLNSYALLADRLGMGHSKFLLENYSFEIINPTYSKVLRRQCENVNLEEEVKSLADELQRTITTSMQNTEVRWQFDSLYTLYRHQLEHNFKLGKPLHTDPSPLRIVDAGFFIIQLLSDEEHDCYRCLGILHKRYMPVHGQFRDLIGKRCENGYQSLHTLVKHPSGTLFNVIIRTRTMDLVAERGITAQWWHVPEEFLPRLPDEARSVAGEIQVFTPQGERRHLPSGATPIDFAYAIHSDVGNHCIGVLVNGERGDVKQPLQMGDLVEIILGGQDAEPHLDWLNFVQTHQASKGIRQWFTKNRRNDMIELGRVLLDRELQPLHLVSTDAHVWQRLTRIAAKEHLKGGKDLLVSIALKRHEAAKIVEQLHEHLQVPNYGEPAFRVNALSPEDNALPRVFAMCCKPVLPADIVGYRRKDKLVIHRRDCARLKAQEELIPVKWDTMPREPNYIIIVEALNRQGLATDLSSSVSLLGLDMQSFNIYRRPDGILAEAHIHLGKTTLAERTRIKEALENVAYVTHIEVIHSSALPTFTQQLVPQILISQPNPYGPKLALGVRFYGRETDCQRISTLLHDRSQNTAILLWGQKRIGKSSLLLHLEEQSRGEFLPIFVDVQGMRDGSTTQFLHHLMERVADVLKEKITEPVPEITVPRLHTLRKDPLAYFDTFMTLVQEITRYRPVVVILDEFQCLCSLREEAISREAIFSRLRSHSQHGYGIHLILSGGGLLSQLTEQCDIASIFNIAYDHKLGCLEKKAANQLIIDGLTRVGTISEDAVDYLLTITAGHPYYLQLLCSRLYEHAQEEKIAITREATASLVHKWLNAADVSRFHHLWEATDIVSTQRNKLILSAIAHIGTTQSEVEYSRLAALVGTRVPEQDLVRALADLSDLGVLKHNRLNYAIEVELFACWLRQHSPFELVSKETHFL